MGNVERVTVAAHNKGYNAFVFIVYFILVKQTHYSRTLVAIGPGQIYVPKNGRQFSNKDFPRGQVNGSADNLDFEKIKTLDRLKNNTAAPLHF